MCRGRIRDGEPSTPRAPGAPIAVPAASRGHDADKKRTGPLPPAAPRCCARPSLGPPGSADRHGRQALKNRASGGDAPAPDDRRRHGGGPQPAKVTADHPPAAAQDKPLPRCARRSSTPSMWWKSSPPVPWSPARRVRYGRAVRRAARGHVPRPGRPAVSSPS